MIKIIMLLFSFNAFSSSFVLEYNVRKSLSKCKKTQSKSFMNEAWKIYHQRRFHRCIVPEGYSNVISCYNHYEKIITYFYHSKKSCINKRNSIIN